MSALFETLVSPFFAVLDFALAAPVVAAAMLSAGAIAIVVVAIA